MKPKFDLRKFFANTVLLILSLWLFKHLIFWKWFLLPCILISAVWNIIQFGFNEGMNNLGLIMYRAALQIDEFGNIFLGPLLNIVFVKPGGYRYGKVGETISSATGKNVLLKKLWLQGRIFNWMLSKAFGKDHAIKAIDEVSS